MVSRESGTVVLALVAYVFGHLDLWPMLVGERMCSRLCKERHDCQRKTFTRTTLRCQLETERVDGDVKASKNETCVSGDSCQSQEICLRTRTFGPMCVKTITEGKGKEDASIPYTRHLLLLPQNKNLETIGYRLNLASNNTDKFLCVWTTLKSVVYLTKTSTFLIVRRHGLIIANDLNDTGRSILIPRQGIRDIKADEDRGMMFLTNYKCDIYTSKLNGINFQLLFKMRGEKTCFLALNSEGKEIYIGSRQKISVFSYKRNELRTLSMNPERIRSLIYVHSQKAVFYVTREAVVKVSPDTKAIDIVIPKPKSWKSGFYSMTFHETILYLSSDRHVGHIYIIEFSRMSITPPRKLKFEDDKEVGRTVFILTLM